MNNTAGNSPMFWKMCIFYIFSSAGINKKYDSMNQWQVGITGLPVDLD